MGYNNTKNKVLELYEETMDIVQELKNNADKFCLNESLGRLEEFLNIMSNKAERVRANCFRLMIAGESKSGKSTFINAYLDDEILPMDVKQCTSSIVEIKYGEVFEVRATRANGELINIKGDSETRKFLEDNAQLNDEYRDIPVPIINEFLVVHGKRTKKSNEPIDVSEIAIKNLMNDTKTQEANIHNLPVNQYEIKIREYINKTKNNWFNIITKIEVLFPLREEIRGVEIIDSPGVYALGGVSDITMDYIKHTDAVIFIKCLVGGALESTNFNNFFDSIRVGRNKSALFLVFTHITNFGNKELNELKKEAYKQFGCSLGEDHILFVDGKLKLYAKEFSSVDENSIKEELLKLNKSDKKGAAESSIISEYLNFTTKDEFIETLQEKSEFRQVYPTLERFGRTAQYISLDELLSAIQSLCTKLEGDLTTQSGLFQEKTDDPTELAKKIAELKQELDSINNKMAKTVDEVARRFQGDGGIIRTTANKEVEDFKSKVSWIDKCSSNAFELLKAHSMSKFDKYVTLTKELQDKVVLECDNELIELSDKSQVSFKSLKPNFTDESFDEIKENLFFSKEAKERKTEYVSNGGWACFEKTEKKYSDVYSQSKHFQLMKREIMSRLEKIKNDMINKLNDFVDDIRTKYIGELSLNSKSLKKQYDALMDAKATAEEIKNNIIPELTELTERMTSTKSEVTKIKGGIESCIPKPLAQKS